MHKKILLVEDNAVLAKNIAKYMEIERIDVESVTDGSRAIEYALSGRYEMMILDIHLPGHISGLDVLRVVRDRKNPLPVLMLTAKSTTHDKITAFEMGADDYLTKPFELAELSARIHARLRIKSKHTNPEEKNPEIPLEIGGITLYPSRQSVVVGGEEKTLSDLEYRLLEYFFKKHQKIVTREDLAENVWKDRSSMENSRTIDIYIGYLRKKIGQDRIVTKKNVGYIFQ